MENDLKTKKKDWFRFIPIGFLALMRTRFLLALRNKTAFIYRFIVPLINTILAIVIPKLIPTGVNYDPNVILNRNNFILMFIK